MIFDTHVLNSHISKQIMFKQLPDRGMPYVATGTENVQIPIYYQSQSIYDLRAIRRPKPVSRHGRRRGKVHRIEGYAASRKAD